MYGNGNHEGGPLKQYSEFVHRLGAAQVSAANASGSSSPRWMSWSVGRATYLSIDADAWVYPLVWDLAKPQWLWLNATLAAIDRSVTPWVVLYTHRALYCTKVLDDGECISEAASLRDGLFDGALWGLEPLLLEHSVDLVFAGHVRVVAGSSCLPGAGRLPPAPRAPAPFLPRGLPPPPPFLPLHPPPRLTTMSARGRWPSRKPRPKTTSARARRFTFRLG